MMYRMVKSLLGPRSGLSNICYFANDSIYIGARAG